MFNATIMVSDSEVESRTLLADVLENRLGYKVVSVSNGSQVIESLYEQHDPMPEVILMDVAPDLADVSNSLIQLRLRFPYLPVIAMTNYGDMKQAARALEAGAMDFMSRPVSHKRLQVGIDNAIKQHRLASEVSRLRREQAMGGDLNFFLQIIYG